MATLPTDLASLRRAVESGERFTYRMFWGHTPRADGALSDAVFSQWFAAGFTEAGVHYPTAEHWMMAGKARLFHDDDALEAILRAGSPAEAKALGRTVRGFDEATWKAHCFALVTAGNVHKFGADPARRAYLLATGDAILVEASPRDRIWGIGMGAQNPEAQDPRNWRGQNLLGFALVRAREQLGSMPAGA